MHHQCKMEAGLTSVEVSSLWRPAEIRSTALYYYWHCTKTEWIHPLLLLYIGLTCMTVQQHKAKCNYFTKYCRVQMTPHYWTSPQRTEWLQWRKELPLLLFSLESHLQLVGLKQGALIYIWLRFQCSDDAMQWRLSLEGNRWLEANRQEEDQRKGRSGIQLNTGRWRSRLRRPAIFIKCHHKPFFSRRYLPKSRLSFKVP